MDGAWLLVTTHALDWVPASSVGLRGAGRRERLVGERGLKNPGLGRPVLPRFIYSLRCKKDKNARRERSLEFATMLYENTTLSGGSLGSCVDEERSQLRELM